jgi:hypothetical protein
VQTVIPGFHLPQGLGIMCGAVGYLGAAAFTRKIYRNIKYGIQQIRCICLAYCASLPAACTTAT